MRNIPVALVIGANFLYRRPRIGKQKATIGTPAQIKGFCTCHKVLARKLFRNMVSATYKTKGKMFHYSK
jgi:hypothetical protein